MTRTVTDSFNVYKEGRMGGNGRRYVIHSVRAMLESPATQEGLRLGELYGYFGHGRRQLTGKMRPAEVEVVMINGKPVVIENVPSNRTTAISLDDDGTIHHTQEVLDTPTGLIVQSMLDSFAGGWSWACEGPSSKVTGDHPRAYYGCDYVLQPNYIPPDRQAAMFESVGVSSQQELIAHNLQNMVGMDGEQVNALLESWSSVSEARRLEDASMYDVMMLEGMLIEAKSHRSELERDLELARQELKESKTSREQMMLEALDTLPVMLTKSQRQALISMQTKEDAQVFKQLLESVAGTPFGTLPLNGRGAPATVKPGATVQEVPGAVIFGHKPYRFK